MSKPDKDQAEQILDRVEAILGEWGGSYMLAVQANLPNADGTGWLWRSRCKPSEMVETMHFMTDVLGHGANMDWTPEIRAKMEGLDDDEDR